jgi:hypothetical protein
VAQLGEVVEPPRASAAAAEEVNMTGPAKAAAVWHKAFMVPGRASRASAVLAAAAPLAAASALVPFRNEVTNTALALVMVAVVVLVVAPGRRFAALVAGISAGVWFDFFLTRPYESFAISRSADVQTTVLLFVVAVGVGELAARERRHRTESTSGTDGLAAVHAVAHLVAVGASSQDVLDAVRDALVPLLHLEGCRFDPSTAPVTVPFIEEPGFVSYAAYRWDAEHEGLPPSPVTLPLRSGGQLRGRFVLRGPDMGVPTEPQRLVTATVLADLAAIALARGQGRPGPVRPALSIQPPDPVRATRLL